MNRFTGPAASAPPPVSPANAMSGPPMEMGGQPAPQPGQAPLGPGMAPPAAPPAAPPSPEAIKQARLEANVVVGGLEKLVAIPRGKLDKKDVFDAASEMIAKGAFPTPAQKQNLIGFLANLPDDEVDIRKAIGGMLLQLSDLQDKFHAVHGATDQPAMTGGPNAV